MKTTSIVAGLGLFLATGCGTFFQVDVAGSRGSRARQASRVDEHREKSAPATKDNCAARVRQNLVELRESDATWNTKIQAARTSPSLHARLGALFALRPKKPDALDTGAQTALVGGPFEVERAIFDELSGEPSIWASLGTTTYGTIDWRYRARGDDAFEIAVACPQPSAQSPKHASAIATLRGPLNAKFDPAPAELSELQWSKESKAEIETGKLVRLGGLPGRVPAVGVAHHAFQVKDVKKSGSATIIELVKEHDEQVNLGCRPRYNGPFQVGESCDYGRNVGRRTLLVTLSDVPPDGIEKGDYIALYARVRSAGPDKRKEGPRESVRSQTVELDGVLVYGLVRKQKLLYSIPAPIEG